MIILSIVGFAVLFIAAIAYVWYLLTSPIKDDKELYEVVYISEKQFEELTSERMLELIIVNKKVMIKLQ